MSLWKTRLRTRAGRLVCLAGLVVLGWGSESSIAQDPPPEKKSGRTDSQPAGKLATLTGAVALGDDLPASFDLAKFPLALTEYMQFPPIPVPADWASRTVEQRQIWMQAFPESDEGKAYLAEREALEKKRKRFEVRFESDGSFTLYDVPPGTYNVYGGQELEHDQKLFVLEVYGQIEVGEVDEVKMPPLPLEVTRVLRPGEAAPAISVAGWDSQSTLTLNEFKDRPVLIYFWTAQSPAAASDLPVLKAMYEQLHPSHDLELLAICADEDAAAAREFVQTNAPPWRQALGGGWSHPSLQDYGVRSLPQYVLIGGDGKILLTNPQFYEAFGQPGFEMAETIRDALSGKTPSGKTPAGDPPTGGQSSAAGDRE